jgi:hypothetical protein
MTDSESDDVVFEAVEGLEHWRGEKPNLTELKILEVRDIFWTFPRGEVGDAARLDGRRAEKGVGKFEDTASWSVFQSLHCYMCTMPDLLAANRSFPTF